MKKAVIVLAACLSFSGTLFSSVLPWSVVYKKIYSPVERYHHQFQTILLFTKKETVAFTQLILSWNAFMPETGGITFFVRVHIAGKPDYSWEPWHKAIAWSQTGQRSFFNKGTSATYNHVRLELTEGLLADGFEIKVEGDNGARALQNMYGFFVCVSNYKEFKPELPYKAIADLPTILVEGVPKKSQKLIDHPRINALCSPTTLSMLLEFLLKEPIDPLETARNVYDEGLDVFGSWPFNIAYAFEKSQGRYFFYTARLSSFAQLHRMLSYGVPVAVSVRGPLKGGRTDYKNGHFVLVVGFDSKHKKVLCYDPAFELLDKVQMEYPIEDFLVAWEKSYRMAYLVHSA